MKKSTIIGIIFTVLLGSLLHFTFEWSGENSFVGLFSAVNESTWEHLKLLFFPLIFFTIFERVKYGDKRPNLITARAIGAIVGLILIPIIFYGYTAILGDNFFIFDILTFIIAVIGAFIVSYSIEKMPEFEFNFISWIIMLLIAFAFMIFTFATPQIWLFLDPVTGGYGV